MSTIFSFFFYMQEMVPPLGTTRSAINPTP
jgi:hypothetical protein